jgi:hypothetical protein
VTEEEYRYVPYGRMPDAKTAAKTPILIDVINAHYTWPNIMKKHSRVYKTIVVFADGHCEVEEWLFSYMDIWEKYMAFLSHEDKEILKKCCKEWDRKIDEMDELE